MVLKKNMKRILRGVLGIENGQVTTKIRPPFLNQPNKIRCIESPTARRAGGLDFPAIGGKKQRHGSALIGAGETEGKALGLKTPNY